MGEEEKGGDGRACSGGNETEERRCGVFEETTTNLSGGEAITQPQCDDESWQLGWSGPWCLWSRSLSLSTAMMEDDVMR